MNYKEILQERKQYLQEKGKIDLNIRVWNNKRRIIEKKLRDLDNTLLSEVTL